ncbi:hypothetical protein ACJX0J_042111, partial [Zea mays]
MVMVCDRKSRATCLRFCAAALTSPRTACSLFCEAHWTARRRRSPVVCYFYAAPTSTSFTP